jgi:bacteriorhodopsin
MGDWQFWAVSACALAAAAYLCRGLLPRVRRRRRREKNVTLTIDRKRAEK